MKAFTRARRGWRIIRRMKLGLDTLATHLQGGRLAPAYLVSGDEALLVGEAVDALRGVVDGLLPVARDTVERAKQGVLQYPTLPVRAALHVATLQRHGIESVLSFDPAFDRLPGLTRLR